MRNTILSLTPAGRSHLANLVGGELVFKLLLWWLPTERRPYSRFLPDVANQWADELERRGLI